MTADGGHVIWFEDLGRGDVARVGGKNASLGEMVRNLGEQGRQGAARIRDDGRRLLAIRRRQWAARTRSPRR